MLMHRAGPDSLSVQAQFLGTCTIPKRKRGLTEVSSENRCYQNTTGGLANLAFSNPNSVNRNLAGLLDPTCSWPDLYCSSEIP